MKKTSLLILLTISALLIFFLSCKEEFPADEVIGNWQIEEFKYFKPDTSFSSTDVFSDSIMNSLTYTDSLFDTLLTRFGWYQLSLYENLSLYAVEFTGDSAYGYWERLTETDIRVWVNGKSQNWLKVDNNTYYYETIVSNKRNRRVIWERAN